MGGLITSSRHERPAPAVAARTSRTRRARSVPFETLNGTQAIRKPRSNNSAPSSLQVTYYWARAIHLSIQSNPPPHSRSTRSTQQHATGRSQQLATQISASHLAPPFIQHTSSCVRVSLLLSSEGVLCVCKLSPPFFCCLLDSSRGGGPKLHHSEDSKCASCSKLLPTGTGRSCMVCSSKLFTVERV